LDGSTYDTATGAGSSAAAALGLVSGIEKLDVPPRTLSTSNPTPKSNLEKPIFVTNRKGSGSRIKPCRTETSQNTGHERPFKNHSLHYSKHGKWYS
jgi:hypothetical protein